MKNASMNRQSLVSIFTVMLLVFGVLGILLTLLFLVGCGGDEEEVPPAEEMSPVADVPAVPDEVRCVVGLTLKSGESCSYVGGGSNFTFNVREDGFGCIGTNHCVGEGIYLNDFVATKNPDGSWTIKSLP